jgi:hypothetical protein
MSTISRTTFTFTVLHRTDEPFLSDDPLQEALARSYDGNAVGATTGDVTIDLPDTTVPEELVELGNDGSFFDDDLGIGTETYTVVIDEKNWED